MGVGALGAWVEVVGIAPVVHWNVRLDEAASFVVAASYELLHQEVTSLLGTLHDYVTHG